MSVDRLHGSGPEPFEACPDGGRCWHTCPLVEGGPEGKGAPCWRVTHSGPLSGVFPDDRWPDDVKAEHDRHPRPAVSEEIQYTGRNTADVRAFIAATTDPLLGRAWLVTKSQTMPTGLQAWRYIRGDQTWADDVAAAVYDATTGEWQPLRRGDYVVSPTPGVFQTRRHEDPA